MSLLSVLESILTERIFLQLVSEEQL